MINGHQAFVGASLALPGAGIRKMSAAKKCAKRKSLTASARQSLTVNLTVSRQALSLILALSVGRRPVSLSTSVVEPQKLSKT